jgi:glycosyltransferase involved in cell wall biosynthesis
VSSAPDITVVIPTKNRWHLLKTTLASALSQEGVEHEVIVVDDGSTDETPARVAQMTDPRLRVLRHEQSTGPAGARNDAIAEARGRWLAFLDDDDLWAPDKLRLQLEAGESSGAVLVYTAAVVLDENRAVVEILEAPDPDEIATLLIPGNAIPAGASNVMASTAAVRELGGYDLKLSQLADWDLWIRLTQAGRAAACPEPLMAYVQHADGMLVTTATSELVDEFDHMVEKHRAVTERTGIEFDRPGLARWIAWGASRSGYRFRAALNYLRAASMYARRRDRWMAKESARDSLGALRGERLTDSDRPHGSFASPAAPEWLALYERPRSRP